MYLVVGTYQGSRSDRYLLGFPVLNVADLQLILIGVVTKYTFSQSLSVNSLRGERLAKNKMRMRV